MFIYNLSLWHWYLHTINNKVFMSRHWFTIWKVMTNTRNENQINYLFHNHIKVMIGHSLITSISPSQRIFLLISFFDKTTINQHYNYHFQFLLRMQLETLSNKVCTCFIFILWFMILFIPTIQLKVRYVLIFYTYSLKIIVLNSIWYQYIILVHGIKIL